MPQYVLALDQGTTSSRAILFNHDAHPIAVAQREFEQILPAPGVDMLPTDIYIATLIEAGVATHPEEAQILATTEGNIALAQAHHRAFVRWVDWMLQAP